MPDEISQTQQPAQNIAPAVYSSPPPSSSEKPFHIAAELKDLEEKEPKSRVLIIVAVALVLIAAMVAVVSFVVRPKPKAGGNVEEAYAVVLPGDGVLATIKLNFNNIGDRQLWIKDIQIKLTAADGREYTDTAANAMDFDRYFRGFPDLRAHSLQPLQVEQKLAPGEQVHGSVIASFPVSLDLFNHRKSLSVLIYPYASAMFLTGGNQPVVVIREKF
jgi:hypothetical protein